MSPKAYWRPKNERTEIQANGAHHLGNVFGINCDVRVFRKEDIRFLEGMIAASANIRLPCEQLIKALRAHGEIEVFLDESDRHDPRNAATLD